LLHLPKRTSSKSHEYQVTQKACWYADDRNKMTNSMHASHVNVFAKLTTTSLQYQQQTHLSRVYVCIMSYSQSTTKTMQQC